MWRSLTFSSLILSSLLGLVLSFALVFADWSAPSFNPPSCPASEPGCNVPLNVGSIWQTKNGALVVNADGQYSTGFIVAGGQTILNGNVGIGTTAPTAPLQIGTGTVGEKLRVAAAPYGLGFFNAGSGVNATVGIYGNSAYANAGVALGKNDGTTFIPQLTLVNSSGNVGIGTTTPSQRLDVSGGIHATADVCTDLAGGKCLSKVGDGGGSAFWAANGSNIHNTNSGNVGIGTTSPRQKLDVNGNIAANGGKGILFFQGGEGEVLRLTGNNGVNMHIENINGTLRLVNSPWNADIFHVDQSGNTHIGGNLQITGTAYATDYFLENTAGSAGGTMRLDGHQNFLHLWSSANTGVRIGNDVTQIFAQFNPASASSYLMGKFGVNIKNPLATVDVAGGIHATADVCTDLAGGKCLSKVDGEGSAFWAANGSNIHNTNSGNVGIGTTSPTAPLQIGTGTVGEKLRVAAAPYGLGFFNAGSGVNATVGIYGNSAYANAGVALGKNDGTTFIPQLTLVNSSGNVGIGTTNPRTNLDVNGNIHVTGIYFGNSPAVTTMGISNNFGSNAGLTLAEGTSYLRVVNAGNSAEHFRITSSGNVGIGTTTPQRSLDVNGSIRIASGAVLEFGQTAVKNYIASTDASNYLAFGTNSGERMRIDSSGKVGIGTTTPSQRLDVAGGIHATADVCTDLAGGKCLSKVGDGGISVSKGHLCAIESGRVNGGTIALTTVYNENKLVPDSHNSNTCLRRAANTTNLYRFSYSDPTKGAMVMIFATYNNDGSGDGINRNPPNPGTGEPQLRYAVCRYFQGFDPAGQATVRCYNTNSDAANNTNSILTVSCANEIALCS